MGIFSVNKKQVAERLAFTVSGARTEYHPGFEGAILRRKTDRNYSGTARISAGC
jgi:hypothetical protein